MITKFKKSINIIYLTASSLILPTSLKLTSLIHLTCPINTLSLLLPHFSPFQHPSFPGPHSSLQSPAMSSVRRRFSMKQPVAVADVGCGCRRSNLSAFLTSLRLKPRRPNTPHSLSSSSLWPSTATSATAPNSSSFSLSSEEEKKEKKEKRAKRRNRGMKKPWSAAAVSVPVVKESSEPYADFRESMVQMIVENDLYAWDELNDLLHRFLSLNSPRHHNLILHAFADLWSGVFSPPSPCRWDNYY